jgi:soluble lytic murein transglycosylase-like protein
MITKPLTSLILAALLASEPAQHASADIIYSFTDEYGVVHFSNVPTDERYAPLMADGAAARKPPPIANHPRPPTSFYAEYGPVIEEIARTYALEAALIHAVVSAESAYNARAVSRKGAAGLMQLMPETAHRYGVTDRFDPVQNLHGGARYLSDLLKMFSGNMSLALAAYNAGENNVVKYGNQIPPFQETKAYVPKVLALYRRYHGSGDNLQGRRGI